MEVVTIKNSVSPKYYKSRGNLLRMSILFCVMFCTSIVGAQTWNNGGITATLSGGTLVISGTGKLEDCGWYSTRSNITKVTIESGVTSIEKNTFFGCDKLTSVTIPNSVTFIGEGAFYGCESLASITIPNSVTSIGKAAFRLCKKLSSITIGNSVTSIGKWAFCDCVSLTSIIFPNSVRTIGDAALWDCENLTSIVFGSGLTSVGSSALFGCEKITSITSLNPIPPKVEEYVLFGSHKGTLYVPQNNIEKYRAAGEWKRFENIVATSTTLPAATSTTLPVATTATTTANPSSAFSVYAQRYVENKVNEWQKKGEFEKTVDWQNRVNETTRKEKVNQLTKEAEKEYIAENSKNITLNTELGEYDADNEVFLVKSSLSGNLLVPVPYGEAQNFKTNWSNLTKTPKYFIENDKLGLAEMTFSTTNGKTYKYSNQASLNYSIANVNYNFDPINLDITATSTVPKGNQNISTVNLNVGKSDVDLNIPINNNKNDKTFVVIIANEKYQESGISQVEFAENDGTIFREYCIKTLGLPEQNVHYKPNATLNNMRSEIKWIKDLDAQFKNKADINIIFYYSGHGTNDELSKSAYLLPTDGLAEDATTAYKLDELYQILGNLSAKSVTVFLDACYSGAGRDGSMLVASKGVVEKVKQGVPTGNTVVFSSSQGNETSFPYKEKGHGLFTYFLLKKMQETKGDVTLGELGNYVTDKVGQQSVVVNRKSQTPTVIPSTSLTNWENLKLK